MLYVPIRVINVEYRQITASASHLVVGRVRAICLLDILQMLVQALSASTLIGLDVNADGDFVGKGTLQEQRNYAVRGWTVFISLPWRIPGRH